MNNINLDENWLLLLKELKESEVSKEQFKQFLEAKRIEKENEKTCD
jgi:hypothetical protein